MKKIILSIILIFLFQQNSIAQYLDTGIYLGVNTGTWFPDGKNKILGNSFMLGYTADAKFSENNTLGLEFSLIKGTSSTPISFKLNDAISDNDEYNGAQITLDYFRKLFDGKNFILEAMLAIGYGNISYDNPSENIDIHKESILINPGVSLRLFTNRRLYFQLKTQYSIANYMLKNSLNPNLEGNYFITKLIIGQTSL